MHKTLGKLHIEKYETFAILGILEYERTNEQKIIIDIEVECDFSKVKESNHSVTNGLDYTKLINFVEEHLIQEKFRLLENCVLSIGQLILKQWDSIHSLHLSISKPDAIEKAQNTKASMFFKC